MNKTSAESKQLITSIKCSLGLSSLPLYSVIDLHITYIDDIYEYIFINREIYIGYTYIFIYMDINKILKILLLILHQNRSS